MSFERRAHYLHRRWGHLAALSTLFVSLGFGLGLMYASALADGTASHMRTGDVVDLGVYNWRLLRVLLAASIAVLGSGLWLYFEVYVLPERWGEIDD